MLLCSQRPLRTGPGYVKVEAGLHAPEPATQERHFGRGALKLDQEHLLAPRTLGGVVLRAERGAVRSLDLGKYRVLVRVLPWVFVQVV